ncbi:Oxidoreductase [Lachnellula occidentalis]|uniref:Oxidoreductase n=1 Tax=Lachnellula occidentalis TaxID=215460 RepID=A0A8H8UJV9_9HELO|nr:Oxidoreductase [Lachnellula occidentalis]
MTPSTSHHLLPSFDKDVETAPLVSVSFAKLESGDKASSNAFFKACKELGFFYLDLFGSELGETIIAEAERLNVLQKEFFKMPFDDKQKYGRPHLDPFYAYRYYGLLAKDEKGVPLRSENYNLRKDDILGQCERLDCAPMILDNNELFKGYALHCHAVVDCMLEHLNTHLELPPGTLANLHRVSERSGDHVRLTQAPPSTFEAAHAQRAEHTDFGSITVLFNWLGGLQVRLPTTEQWVYVRPVPGSCIINLGDAMVKFTAGLLRSNVHRVVPPPGEQAGLVRNSLVFFSRPEDAVVLKRLQGGLIDAQPVAESGDAEMTAHEWIMAKGTGQLPGIYTKKGFELKKNDERLKHALVSFAV